MPLDPAIALGAAPQQAQQNPLAGLATLMQLVHAVQQNKTEQLKYKQMEETQPLTLDELRLKNDQHRMLARLAEGALGGADQQGAGVQPQPSQNLDVFARKLRMAQALSFIDAPKGRAQMEALKLEYPDVKWEGGIALHPRTGLPMTGAPVIPQVNQQGYATTKVVGPDGQISIATTPGASEAFRQQTDIAEGAKARRDLVTVPSTGPTAPPRFASRQELLDEAAKARQPAAAPALPDPLIDGKPLSSYPPAQQAAIRSVMGADAAGLPASVRVPPAAATAAPAAPAPLGSVPTSSAVAAAGQSPRQEAENAARKEFMVTDAKHRAELYSNLQKSSLGNQEKIAKFERIGKLLGDYSGGKLADTGYELSRFGTSLGIKIPDLPNKEAANTLSNEVALELRSTADGTGMPGAMSDADRNFLKSMTPQLAQTAQGRKLIIESRVAVWKREQQIADMARKYKQKHGDIDEEFFTQLQGWSNRNPIFRDAAR